MRGGGVHNIGWGQGTVRGSSLLADDTIVICDVVGTHVEYFRKVLTWFHVVSGLKIDLRKCENNPSWFDGEH